MPRYANVRTRALRRLLRRMGFVEIARNDHWRYRHSGLGLYTKISFGNNEIEAPTMGEIITKQLRMTVDEFPRSYGREYSRTVHQSRILE